MSNCFVSGNYGGGIFNYGSRFGAAELSVNNSIISGNYGGGISNFAEHGGATLTITDSTISGNSAEYRRRHREWERKIGQLDSDRKQQHY